MPKRKAAVAGEDRRKKAKTGDTHSIAKFDLKWTSHGKLSSNGIAPLMLLSGTADEVGHSKIAGFDIDFTVIQTKSGRKFATGAKDWKWLFPCVPDKLQSLHKDGYRIVFFTNQAGIEKLKVSPEEIFNKVNDIIEQLDIPVFCFVCTGENQFRKPSTYAWNYFVESCNGGVEPDLKKCVYVGDAAGRPKNWAPGKPKDFSCSDRMFAANIGIDFETPEEYFLNEDPVDFSWGSINPTEYLQENKDTKHAEQYHSQKSEMVLMVGPPASGKSTFVKQFLEPKGYTRVNRDTLKTLAQCLKVAENCLTESKSVVIDNTNPSEAARADYVDLAKSAGVPVRCFMMQTPLDLARHLNYVRQTQTDGVQRRVPDVGYNMYKKNYNQPQLSEGFSEIKKINFIPNFTSTKNEKIFKNWSTAGH